MTVTEAVTNSGLTSSASYAGIEETDDFVFAVQTESTQTKKSDWIVCADHVREHSGALNASTSDNTYIRTGPVTTKSHAQRTLTINGDRTRVMVTRQVDGVNQVYFVDLTQMQSLLQSPAFYLQQNDLVYVTPNDKRKREAQSVGNTFNTPAVWISLASLATTIAALLIR